MHRNERHADPVGCGRHALQVLIASEVRFVRESLGEILGRGGTTSVIGYCADFGQTLSMSRELRPDMVLLDAAVRDGPMAVRRLREVSAGLRVVVFAVSESVESVLSWAEAGAAGYIPCTAGASDLCALVDDISAGRQACSGVVAAGLLQRIAASSVGPPKAENGPQALTPRELEIVRLISTGLSNKEIARRLNIGVTTTKSHVHNALGKLNVQRRGQVATWMHARSPPN
jgi:two-component system, NarL family, nitrate/nitrite response regulator NarL